MIIQKDLKIQEFIAELTGFAAIAEDTLNQIEAHKDEKKDLFSVFSERMFAIRGTADQLGLEHISHIAHLGEEIAIKAVAATTRAHVRKCTGSLWDALTTVKHLLKHHGGETSEEQESSSTASNRRLRHWAARAPRSRLTRSTRC